MFTLSTLIQQFTRRPKRQQRPAPPRRMCLWCVTRPAREDGYCSPRCHDNADVDRIERETFDPKHFPLQ